MAPIKSKRKGQSTMEYLYTYGWMILVVIIAMLILWQIGVFKLPVFKRGYLGFSEVLPADWGVYNTNEVYLKLVNYAGVTVEIPAGGVYLSIGIVNCSIIPAPPSSLILNPGDENSRAVVLYCSTPPKISDVYDIGDYYEADVVISYINTKTGKLHKSIGKIFGPVEGPFEESTTTTITTTSTTTTTTTTTSTTTSTVIGYVNVLQAFPRNASEV